MNRGRQQEVDLLRGFTALILIECHVGLYLGNNAGTGMFVFADISGSEFGAPIFMALMGISMAYSRKQNPGELLARGIKLFVGAYFLNFFRSILPLWIFGPIDEWTSIEAFFVVDIFQFAGLAFIFFALLKKIKVPSFGILLISLVMAYINQFIMLPESVAWNSQLLTGIVNLFTPVTEWSCFPFLTWFFFPAFGYAFGSEILIKCDNKNRLYGVLLPIGLAGVVYVYYQFYKLYPNYTSYYYGNNFYYMGIKNILLNALFICFALAFWYFVGKILPQSIDHFLSYLSKNLTLFYIVSWIVISILIHLQALFAWNFGLLATIILIVAVIVVCIIMVQLVKRINLNSTE